MDFDHLRDKEFTISTGLRIRSWDGILAEIAKLLEERFAFLLAYFDAHPCVDRGEKDPAVLEFDHLHAKRFDIAYALRARSWADVVEEISKCEVVCANCHRVRTARRGGWRRYRATVQSGRR